MRQSDFDEDVRWLCHNLRTDPPSSVRLRRVRAALVAQARGRLSGSGFPDAEDVADEALYRFVSAATQGRIRCDDRPGHYLRRSLSNLCRDVAARRRVAEHAEPPDEPPGIDPMDATVERLTSSARVDLALAAADAARDDLAVRVLSTYLDLARGLGDHPTQEEVASEASCSREHVSRVFARTRRFLQAPEDGWRR